MDVWRHILPRSNLTTLKTFYISNEWFRNFIRNNFHNMKNLIPRLYVNYRNQFILSDGQIIPINVGNQFYKLLNYLNNAKVYVESINQSCSDIGILSGGKLLIFNTTYGTFESIPEILGEIIDVSCNQAFRSVLTNISGIIYSYKWYSCGKISPVNLSSIITENSKIINIDDSDENKYYYVRDKRNYDQNFEFKCHCFHIHFSWRDKIKDLKLCAVFLYETSSVIVILDNERYIIFKSEKYFSALFPSFIKLTGGSSELINISQGHITQNIKCKKNISYGSSMIDVGNFSSSEIRMYLGKNNAIDIISLSSVRIKSLNLLL